MRLSRSTINIILVILYATAVIARVGNLARSPYPYYKGVSASNYRFAFLIERNGHLPRLDRKASWPEGLRPAMARTSGVEFLTGYLFKVVKYFSEVDRRTFSRHLTIMFSSLLVFTVYAISYNLWGCQAGSLFASFLVALFPPLVMATSGREYWHIHYAAVLISLHIALLQWYAKRSSLYLSFLSSLLALGLLATWGAAMPYLALTAFVLALRGGSTSVEKQMLLLVHTAFIILATLLLPQLTPRGVIFSGTASCYYASMAYLTLEKKFRSRVPAAFAIPLGALALTLLFEPLRAGLLEPSFWDYLLYRIRYLMGKPEDPSALPALIRVLWSQERSYPSPYELFSFFFPLLLFVPPLVGGLTALKRVARRSAAAPAAIAILAASLYALDGHALVLAAVGVFTLISACFFSFRESFSKRGAFVSLGTFLVLAQLIYPHGKVDVTYQLARRLGIPPSKQSRFTWVSIGNADKDLVKFLATRTSTRAPFLAPPDISSLLLVFAGRTTTLVPAIATEKMVDKTVNLISKYYGDEPGFYQVCDSLGIEYVIYSIDILLDASRDSQRYLAGVDEISSESVAYKMHFFPAQLDHFNLVYENDNYRVFKVTSKVEPVFLTDHPPVYHHDILEKRGGSLSSFYDRIIFILLTYGKAVQEQVRRNDTQAARLFKECLVEDPLFTKARIGLGTSLLRLGELRRAKESFLAVLRYAPDNAEALYSAAYTMSKLGETEEAEGLIDVLLKSTGDMGMLRKAGALKAVLERNPPGRPWGSGSP